MNEFPPPDGWQDLVSGRLLRTESGICPDFEFFKALDRVRILSHQERSRAGLRQSQWEY